MLAGESLSIANQKQILESYAAQNGYTPFLHLCDEGYSGTQWDRPGWQQLIEMVERDEVNAILVKTMDRMGRDYLRMGLYRDENVKHKLKKHEIFFQNVLKDLSAKKKQAIGLTPTACFNFIDL